MIQLSRSFHLYQIIWIIAPFLALSVHISVILFESRDDGRSPDSRCTIWSSQSILGATQATPLKVSALDAPAFETDAEIALDNPTLPQLLLGEVHCTNYITPHHIQTVYTNRTSPIGSISQKYLSCYSFLCITNTRIQNLSAISAIEKDQSSVTFNTPLSRQSSKLLEKCLFDRSFHLWLQTSLRSSIWKQTRCRCPQFGWRYENPVETAKEQLTTLFSLVRRRRSTIRGVEVSVRSRLFR
jgi:hypothetical protein